MIHSEVPVRQQRQQRLAKVPPPPLKTRKNWQFFLRGSNLEDVCPKKCRKIGRSFQLAGCVGPRRPSVIPERPSSGRRATTKPTRCQWMVWWGGLENLQHPGFSPSEKVVVIYRPIFVWKDFFFVFRFPVKRIPAETMKRHLNHLITSLVTSFPIVSVCQVALT